MMLEGRTWVRVGDEQFYMGPEDTVIRLAPAVGLTRIQRVSGLLKMKGFR
jgi:hypothetical protein